MKNTVYFKFIFGYLLFGLLSFITITTLTSKLAYEHLIKVRAKELYTQANIIANQYSVGTLSDSKGYSLQVISVDKALNARVMILNTEGKILLDSRTSTLTDDDVITDFDPSYFGNHYYKLSGFYGLYDENVLSVMATITHSFDVSGYVILHTPIDSIAQSRNELLNIVYITFGVIFLTSLIILLIFNITVYKPLKKITLGASEYAKGNFSYGLSVHTTDEIGYLAHSLNFMAQELKSSEEYQKNFIANISHDFRSPLTSIKGYVEALLDGTIPPEMQEKYLNIVLFETERLNKLTSSLLTLNTWDKKQNVLELSDFDINRVIKNTLGTFEGICNKKRIQFHLTFAAKHYFVNADIGKIQQVLYNLIDNALKFSNNNSVIEIDVNDKNEKVFISIKDSGIGIPRDSIKKIWDRFYKTDLSRGKNKTGTGLGLSITKEIIQSHNENINVISTEGVGTEFIFTLQKSKASN